MIHQRLQIDTEENNAAESRSVSKKRSLPGLKSVTPAGLLSPSGEGHNILQGDETMPAVSEHELQKARRKS